MTSLSNEMSSLIDSQTVLIQELEMMLANKVMWIYSEISVHERLSSRTSRFKNTFSEQKNASGDERRRE
jgi:hypothetical protein